MNGYPHVVATRRPRYCFAVSDPRSLERESALQEVPRRVPRGVPREVPREVSEIVIANLPDPWEVSLAPLRY